MKVVLNCSYGENVAGEIVDLKKEQAEGLISSGFAHEPSEDAPVTSDSKAVIELKTVRLELDEVKNELALVTAERDALLLAQGVSDGKDGKAGK